MNGHGMSIGKIGARTLKVRTCGVCRGDMKGPVSIWSCAPCKYDLCAQCSLLPKDLQKHVRTISSLSSSSSSSSFTGSTTTSSSYSLSSSSSSSSSSVPGPASEQSVIEAFLSNVSLLHKTMYGAASPVPHAALPPTPPPLDQTDLFLNAITAVVAAAKPATRVEEERTYSMADMEKMANLAAMYRSHGKKG